MFVWLRDNYNGKQSQIASPGVTHGETRGPRCSCYHLLVLSLHLLPRDALPVFRNTCLKKIRKHVTTYICPQCHKCKARNLRASSTIPEAVQERYKYKGDSARGDRREDSACHSRLATGYDYGGTYRARGAVHITDEVCARYSATPPLKHS